MVHSSSIASTSGLSPGAMEFTPGQPFAPAAHRSSKTSNGPPPPAKPVRSTAVGKSTAEDLTTRIHEDIDHGEYECVICTNEVVRTSRLWSCSICWTVIHLHCVRKWYNNQTRGRDEEQRQTPQSGAGQQPSLTMWRCPGCNSSLFNPPGPSRCWCGKEVEPRPIAGLPPHTCGQTCSKSRATCPHPCSLICHAGPCPPCTLMGPTQDCYCGKHVSTKRCTETDYENGWSCQEICGELLSCGEHTCCRPCHMGLCGACAVPVEARCYCGKEVRNMPCEQRDDIKESFNYGQTDLEPAGEWFEGSFSCKKACTRKFDCGFHACQKQCHPQDEEAAHCPLSHDVVTHCPCGKTPLNLLEKEPRKSCQNPIPHCDKPCNKRLPCGHNCAQKCHDGPCAPCYQTIEISCRCGRVTEESSCHQGTVEQPMCARVCKVQLNCGRHECGQRCCPGEKKALARRKSKVPRYFTEDFEPEHICVLACGRKLKCGKHECQQRCHRGPCSSCLEAVFEEISCSCGRTVLEPPQPCGTRPPECRFPCTKPRRCGHPETAHQCHPEDVPCPECPFLVEKLCICGKKTLKNQPCWLNGVRCGLPCGKKLKCGAHECRKPCHRPGECEDVGIPGSHCSQPCGKVRKSCEHTCLDECHAPYPCKEDKPCQSKTFTTCPCQNRKQEVRCQATRLHPSSERESTLKCDDSCLVLERNRRLAEALNINPDKPHTENDHVPYSTTTLRLFWENDANGWAEAREREFRVFAAAGPDEKRLRFKPMRSQQRAFLHALAEDYGLDSESQDPEPHRHVCVFKTPKFVSAPRKTVGQCLKIRPATTATTAAAVVRQPSSAVTASRTESKALFNGILLKDVRFGLTSEEVLEAIEADISTCPLAAGLSFDAVFLPSGDVVIKAGPTRSGSGVVTTSPEMVEAALYALKPKIGRTATRQGLVSTNVVLGHLAPLENTITRREGDGGGGGPAGGNQSGGGYRGPSAVSESGWSEVASRGSWRRGIGNNQISSGAASTASAPPAGRGFMTLLKKKTAVAAPVVKGDEEDEVAEKLEGSSNNGVKGDKPAAADDDDKTEEVEDDWLTAAEKLEGSSNEVVEGDKPAADDHEKTEEMEEEEQKVEEEETGYSASVDVSPSHGEEKVEQQGLKGEVGATGSASSSVDATAQGDETRGG
ncbi:putative fkbp12-associated protein [Apodospora peruviana]|uniref:Fkbp12-associated protein n=1 Tax=Apodospora peruviana TaxID=516989 RepID=A0AAE0IP92_9PEZI|nr:putative fkbp12-associated protein [Apodospora peruviana]